MKKMIKIALLIYFCLLPNLVKADMGAPDLTSYKVVVNNPNGAKYYEYEGQLIEKGTYDVNTICTVIAEATENKEMYLQVQCGNNETPYLINSSDVVLLTNEFDYRILPKEKKRKVYVWGNDCYMYKGPSEMYGKIDGNSKIPTGTILEYEYADNAWIYVEYNGNKGFVYNFSHGFTTAKYSQYSQVADVLENSKLLVNNDKVILYDEPFSENIVNNNLKYGEEYIAKYLYYNKTKSYYIGFELNGKLVWVQSSSYYEDNVDAVLSADCITLYVFNKNGVKLYDRINGQMIKTIPEKTEIKVEYEITSFNEFGDMQQWYYVIYENNKGWVTDLNQDVLSSYYPGIYKVLESTVIYEYPDITSKKIGTIDKDEEVKETYIYFVGDGEEEWYYVNYGELSGWVEQKNKNLKHLKNVEECIIPVVKEKIKDDIEKQENIISPIKNPKEIKRISPKEVIIFSLLCAILLTIFSLVTIKLIRKRKFQKSDIKETEKNDGIESNIK